MKKTIYNFHDQIPIYCGTRNGYVFDYKWEYDTSDKHSYQYYKIITTNNPEYCSGFGRKLMTISDMIIDPQDYINTMVGLRCELDIWEYNRQILC